MSEREYLLNCHIWAEEKVHVHVYLTGWRRFFGPPLRLLLWLFDVKIALIEGEAEE